MSSPAFRPDHRSPAGGLPAWDAPDPTLQPAATVAAGLAVQVVERNGAWAKVLFDNGWSGWVDGRLLEQTAFADPAPKATTWVPAPSPTDITAPVEVRGVRVSAPLIGGALIVVSTMLPWLSFGGASENSFGIPVKVLFDPKTQSTGALKLGFVLLLLGAATIASALGRAPAQVGRVAGGAAVLLATLLVGQLQRVPGETAVAASVFALLGTGVYLTMAGGVLAAMAKGQSAQ